MPALEDSLVSLEKRAMQWVENTKLQQILQDFVCSATAVAMLDHCLDYYCILTSCTFRALTTILRYILLILAAHAA